MEKDIGLAIVAVAVVFQLLHIGRKLDEIALLLRKRG